MNPLIFVCMLVGSSPFVVLGADVSVYFSPNGGATAAIVQEIATAKHEVLVQAYSFT